MIIPIPYIRTDLQCTKSSDVQSHQRQLETRKRIIKACIASGFFFERAGIQCSSPNSLSASPLARTEIPPATQAGMLNKDVICITWIVIMAMKIMKMLRLRMMAYLTRSILIFLHEFYFFSDEMELYKVLIAVVFITTSSSFTHSASWRGAASTAQLLINYLIPLRVKNAIQEVNIMRSIFALFFLVCCISLIC